MLIRDFTDGDASAFYAINAAWIEAMFALEPHDEDVLRHPRAQILDRGGVILIAELAGVAVGTGALMPDGAGVMSGGDDSAIKMIELSDEPHEVDVVKSDRYKPARYASWSDRKVHGAGVTAILPLHVDDESGLVVTGSYDDHIRMLRVSTHCQFLPILSAKARPRLRLPMHPKLYHQRLRRK